MVDRRSDGALKGRSGCEIPRVDSGSRQVVGQTPRPGAEVNVADRKKAHPLACGFLQDPGTHDDRHIIHGDEIPLLPSRKNRASDLDDCS